MACWIAIAGLAGCGGEVRVPVFPVSGRVLFKGQPATGAQVVLHPAAGSNLPSNLAATGLVGDDGSFKIGAYELADGAPVGEYVATVQWLKMVTNDGGTGRGPNVLPKKYADPTSSTLKLTVQNGNTELQPWDLTN